MRFLSEFRNGRQAIALAQQIGRIVSRPWVIMEVCGGQTHSIIRNGIDQVLPSEIELIHGPGCPVCVTPLSVIDKALCIAARPEVILCTFGDMLRVPGSTNDLFTVRAEGGDVRVVYSPLDAVQLARQNPGRQVVFLGIGFETTAPASAMAVKVAKIQCLNNFTVLVSHVLVPPAIEAMIRSPHNRIQGFLAAGHVCSVMGFHQYHRLAKEFRVPIVVTGFEPLDLLEGIRRVILQLEQCQYMVENAYPRVVSEAGNQSAQRTIDEVFERCDQAWRGLGIIPESGWRLRGEFAQFDAERRFDLLEYTAQESSICRAGQVLTGMIKPYQCEAFGSQCTPRNPLGAPMVSSEGACAAYYQYGKHPQPVQDCQEQ